LRIWDVCEHAWLVTIRAGEKDQKLGDGVAKQVGHQEHARPASASCHREQEGNQRQIEQQFIDVVVVLQAAQERVDAALTHQIQPLLSQLLHHLVTVTWTPRNRGEQAHIERAFE
jgi:hypothetical protein